MAPSILKTLTAAAGFYASFALAAPLHKRAIVWETETEVIVKTVTVTTTCSGTPGPDATIHPPKPTHDKPKVTPTFTPSRPTESSSSVTSSSSSSIPPPPPPPPTEPAVPPPPPPPPAAPTPKPKPNPPPQYNPPPPKPTPKPTPTSSPKPPPPPPPPPKPTVAPPPQVSVPPPPPPPEPTVAPKPPTPSPKPNPPSYGGGGGECSPGNPCAGEITFYDGGLGACGSQVSTESEDAIALPHAFMGTESNNNQYCGKTVTIKFKGVTSTATIKDKCMGCTGYSIDMTRHLFYKFGEESDGRLDGAEWYINE